MSAAAGARRESDSLSATRLVSLMAPMRNEADHIENLIADIAEQDVDADLELLVADGSSTDGSVERLREAAARHGVEVTVIANPERWVSQALNLCIRAAKGSLIVRVDCHSRYPQDYVRRCVIASEETEAENVGGVFIPTGRTVMERAVACAMDSPFGGVHWTRHGDTKREDVDTVPYGAFRRRAFDMAGLFDEELIRNQDDEFNLRLRLAGGRVVLDPTIRIHYTPRGSLARVFRQYFEYGRWKPAVMRKHNRPTSARSLAPAAFVGAVAILAVLTPFVPFAGRALALVVGAYALGAVAFGVYALHRRGESWMLLPRLVVVYPTFHVAYGLGMLSGLARRTPHASGSGAPGGGESAAE